MKSASGLRPFIIRYLDGEISGFFAPHIVSSLCIISALHLDWWDFRIMASQLTHSKEVIGRLPSRPTAIF